MSNEEKFDQVVLEYSAKFGDPEMPGLPDFFEQQLPDNVDPNNIDELCAYIRRRIKENKPFEDESCGL